MLAISEKSLYRWIKERKLKAHKIGGTIRIPKTELLKIIKPINVTEGKHKNQKQKRFL